MSIWNIFRHKSKVDFYHLLLRQAEKTLGGCKALSSFLRGEGDSEEVNRFEQEADDIRRILIDELNRTFITPMDREDIFALSRAIDDVLDHAKNTVKEMQCSTWEATTTYARWRTCSKTGPSNLSPP